MPSLQQTLAKAKLNNLPFHPPSHPESTPGFLAEEAEDIFPENEGGDTLKPLPEHGGSVSDDSSSASSASSVGSTGTIRPNERKGRYAREQEGR